MGLATVCAILAGPSSAWAVPDTFTVDNLGDAADPAINGSCDTDGGTDDTPCTLRAAIAESNANADVDAIQFDASIAGTGCQTIPANCTITVQSTALSVSDAVTINGCSSDPNRPQPCVGIAEPTHLFSVLLVNTPDVTVRGLAFFDLLGGVRYGPGGSNGAVKNNWFGLSLDGTAAGGGTGLQVAGSGNTIGGPGGATGTAPADRNVFAANTLPLSDAVGLQIFDGSGAADDNVVQGNYFGTNAQGTAAIPNGDNIKVIGSGAVGNVPTGNTVGGEVTGAAAATAACDGVCNLIAAADGSNTGDGHGIDLAGDTVSESPAQGTIVRGNYIGTDVAGAANLGNVVSGVTMDNPMFPADGDGNVIGGDSAASQNLISNSGADAIQIAGSGSDRNLIARNHGSNNGGLFIDLGPDGPGNVGGPNEAIAAPTVTSGATSHSVSGAGAEADATVRVYRTGSAAGADPNGIVAFVGQAMADGSGSWALNCPGPGCAAEMPGSGRVTANQTDANNNSSELATAMAYAVVSPNTTITGGPGELTNDRSPTFNFSSNEAGSTFQCRVDGGAFAGCSTPRTTAALADGDHSFRVRARDTGTNLDPTPASRSFRVDATAPDTEIVKGPKRKVRSRKKRKRAKFLFQSNEPGASAECSLDGAGFEPCASPFQVKVKRGKHLLEVRATDQAGNTGSAAEHAWKLKRKAG